MRCFAFLPAPSPLAFWARRQAHETGIHRADVESAGFACTAEHGWFLKTLPNAMMLDWPAELLIALNDISSELDPRQLANISLVAERR